MRMYALHAEPPTEAEKCLLTFVTKSRMCRAAIAAAPVAYSFRFTYFEVSEPSAGEKTNICQYKLFLSFQRLCPTERQSVLFIGN